MAPGTTSSHSTGSTSRILRSAWAMLNWWPIRRTDQSLFAEALSQAFLAGLDVGAAMRITASIIPGPRLRAAVREMASHVRSGLTLAESLRATRANVAGELLAALAVGEERGDLPRSLSGFASQYGGDPGRRLAAAIRRRPETVRFAASLSRLLRDQRLTVDLVEDAGRLAAGDKSAFTDAVLRVAEEMRSGADFPEALFHESRFFDQFFCALVGATSGRDHLRAVLARLGEVADFEPRAASLPTDR